MEFKVNSKELEKLLNKIIPAVPTRTPMQILENFLFEIKDGILTIYATDLEISLKSSMTIPADEDAKLVVPAKLLHDIVRTLGDTSITFVINAGGKVKIITDNGEYSISYLDPDEYPEIPSFPNEDSEEEVREFNISGEELDYALEKSSFAMSKEEMRPAMMGTLFEFTEEGLRFVATDGHRLVNILKKNIKVDFEDKYIIPEKAIEVLKKVLDEKDVKIYLSKTNVSFVLSDIELITRLIGQKYPDYSSVIPYENEKELYVQQKDLHNAIKRMMLFSSSNTKRVKFAVIDNQLEISAEDIDLGASGKEKLSCEYKAEENIEIGFNSSYVNDILGHLADTNGKLLWKLHSPTKAVIIEPEKQEENTDLMMLLMPVRLNN